MVWTGAVGDQFVQGNSTGFYRDREVAPTVKSQDSEIPPTEQQSAVGSQQSVE